MGKAVTLVVLAALLACIGSTTAQPFLPGQNLAPLVCYLDSSEHTHVACIVTFGRACDRTLSSWTVAGGGTHFLEVDLHGAT